MKNNQSTATSKIQLDTIDDISMASNRALGILHSVALQFDGGSSRMSDELITYTLEAVISEIRNIQSHLRTTHTKS
jgi:hypothetical protein